MDRKIWILGVCLVIAVGLIAQVAIAGDNKGKGKGKPACNDGIDNDNDGYIDMSDLGCKNKGDKDELNMLPPPPYLPPYPTPVPPVYVECTCDGNHELNCTVTWDCEPEPICTDADCVINPYQPCEPVWSCCCGGTQCEPECTPGEDPGTYNCSCGGCTCNCAVVFYALLY